MSRLDDTTTGELNLAAADGGQRSLAASQAPPPSKRDPSDSSRLRRVWAVWALLFFNVLGSGGNPTVIPFPHRIEQLFTQGSLLAALVLALMLNPKVRLRPNLFLTLYSLLCVSSLMTSVRFVSLGTDYRAFRLVVYLIILWLLTPWWGRRDLLMLRNQVRFLGLIMISVMLGFFVGHGAAMSTGRLGGAIWPIPATQVAHYMSELTGIVLILWICRMVTRRQALVVVVLAFVALLLTHTRTALVGLLVGLLVAGLSLFIGSKRVRRVFLSALLVMVFVVLPFSSVITHWLDRGENQQQLSSLTGRTIAWTAVLSEHRPLLNTILGSGLSNKGVDGATGNYLGDNGLAIDSGWISTYQDQGIVGDVLEGAIFLALLVGALLRPRGPTRAIALFIIVYCFIASFTESGMGDASTYLLDLTIAASLIAFPATVSIGNWTWSRPALAPR